MTVANRLKYPTLWLYAFLLVLGSQSSLLAQVVLPQITDQHKQVLGVSTGLSVLRVRQPDDSWRWWAGPAIAPKWGYFVQDNLALGIMGEYFFGNLGTLAKTPSAYSLGAWGRYYLPVKRTRRQAYWGEDGNLVKIRVRKDSVKAPAFRCYFEVAYAYISRYSVLTVHDLDSIPVTVYPDVHYLGAGFGTHIRLNKRLYFNASVWAVYFFHFPEPSLRFSPSVGRLGLAYFFHFPKRKT